MATHAEVAEAVIIASLVLSGSRAKFQRRVIGEQRPYLDLYVLRAGRLSRLSSTSRSEYVPGGINLTPDEITRFERNGFSTVHGFASGDTEIGARVRRALRWLVESRMDTSYGAALVKTVTALESLVVVGDEQVSRALPQRTAHLLSDEVQERRALRRVTQQLYHLRGEIVHGRSDADERTVAQALERADRLVVLLLLVLAASGPRWKTAIDMKTYCSGPTEHAEAVIRPWRARYLRHALRETPAPNKPRQRTGSAGRWR